VPLAPLEAELRMMGADSTWVARGPGYELVARSRPDMPLLNTELGRLGRAYKGAFGSDAETIIVSVRRVTPDPHIGTAPPPLPPSKNPVVEAVVGDVAVLPEEASGEFGRAGRAGGGRQGGQGRGQGGPPRESMGARAENAGRAGALGIARRVLHAWLSARATTLTGRAAEPAQQAGETMDPRVPAWVEDAVVNLATDSMTVTRLAAQLQAQRDSLYPLEKLFSMSRPTRADLPRVQPSERSGRGGYGGGERQGMRRGGVPAGAGGYGFTPILRGEALFSLEANVVGHYLASREGPQLIGAIADAQMQGKPALSALAGAKMVPADYAGLEAQWRNWLDYRTRYSGKK
jgi:hypothetical protein